jgi:epoxyqueuosine reductase
MKESLMRNKTMDRARIEASIKDFINLSGENTLKNEDKDTAWADPLVGFSTGSDPIYLAYKEHIGPFHWTPRELFEVAFPEADAADDELTVISWILPQTEETKDDMRKEAALPSESWARARIFGEEVNNKLRQNVVAMLRAEGIDAVAPMVMSEWKMVVSNRFGYASMWSERHAAYASGLGTFGLCDGLITAAGKAMRCGSVVARLQIPPTPRPYTNYREYCLFFSQGTCGKCIERCPAGAVTTSGHDKSKCMEYLQVTRTYVTSTFGFEGYGCGFCQSGVPCESRIPVPIDGDKKG